jgi:hypothetical protein
MDMRTLPVALIGLLLAGGVSAASAATPPQFSLGLGLDYARGDFGTASTSSYTTIPLTLDWFPSERFSLELTVPFLYQSTITTGYAATTGGVPAAQAYYGGRGMNGSGQSVVVSGSEDQSGLGDITLLPAYNLLLDGEGSPQFGLTCYLKFPTADEDKGLGTGSFDWGPGLTLSKWLGDWQPFAEGRYIFQGASRAETGARDYLLADAGLGYGWSEELYTALFARAGSATFDGMTAPLELRLKTVWGFGENTSTEFYLLKGLSDGSPEYGGGLAFFVGF